MSDDEVAAVLTSDQAKMLKVLQHDLADNFVRACRDGLHAEVGVVNAIRGGQPDKSYERIFREKRKIA